MKDVYFKFFNVIQFGAEQDIDDIVYTTPVTNETILYPQRGANAISME